VAEGRFLKFFVVMLSGLVGLALAAPGLTFTAGASVDYDDNIFQYSARDESIFKYREQPNRFPFRSLDDAKVDISARMTWRPRLLRQHTTQLALAAVAHEYLSNPAKSYLSGLAKARQYLARSFHAEVSYLLIPRYLIRYYHDPRQFTSYRPCTFTEHLVSISAGWKPQTWLELMPSVRYEIDRYQAPFEFYNTTAWRGGADLAFTPLKALGLSATYEFKAARTGRVTSPDVSYDQHSAGISLKPHLGPVVLELGYDYERRGYTASAAVDTTHAGRVDATQAIRAGVTVALSRAISVTGDFRHEVRSSSSPYRAEIDEIKDYSENVVNLGIKVGGNR
jgi:hypothetical protein